MDFLVPKHHNKALILLLFDSRQSQLHFGTKINFLELCVAKMMLNLARERQKIGILQKQLKFAPKRPIFLHLRVLGKY